MAEKTYTPEQIAKFNFYDGIKTRLITEVKSQVLELCQNFSASGQQQVDELIFKYVLPSWKAQAKLTTFRDYNKVQNKRTRSIIHEGMTISPLTDNQINLFADFVRGEIIPQLSFYPDIKYGLVSKKDKGDIFGYSFILIPNPDSEFWNPNGFEWKKSK